MKRAPLANELPLSRRAIVCTSCSAKERMPIVAAHRTTPPEGGEVLWELLTCLACAQLTLRKGESSVDESELFRWQHVYPAPCALRGLPGEVSRAYEAAVIVRTLDPKHYAALLGMVIEVTCSDLGAWGQNVECKLRDLASRALAPDSLADYAQAIDAFHATNPQKARPLDVADLPLLEPLCEALLTYCYVGPALMSAAKRAAAAR